MFAIFRKEITSFFNSLIAYIVIGAFLVTVGLIVWVFPGTNVLDYGYADMGVFFSFTPYVLLFLIPAITMRSFAEEYRNGTMELLLTKPISEWSLVVGKFLANWCLVGLSLLPTLTFYKSLDWLGNPPGNIDSAAVFGSYIGLMLLSGVLVALGLLTSSLNQNQIVAFVLAVFGGFLFYTGFSAIAELLGSGPTAFWFSYLSLDEQYDALGRGLIDSRNVVYLLSVSFSFLGLTQLRICLLRN